MAGQIAITFPPLPAGFDATPDGFLQWISENAIFEFAGEDGGLIAGQTGGAEPSSDIGLYISGRKLKVFDAELGQYVSIDTVPIGAVVPFFGNEASTPEEYAFCDGRELAMDEYPELWAIIKTSDPERRRNGDSDDSFRVPDLRGRAVFGAGVGAYYDADNSPTGQGVMRERPLGEMSGTEWVKFRAGAASGAPSQRQRITSAGSAVGGANITEALPPAVSANWIMRKK